jgi:uncharacterized SAM-binding protein YcdF (DUF218 family)
VLAAYWIFSAPACAERLVLWKGGAHRPLTSAADARGARVVVVLGAGNNTIQAGGLSINQVSWEAGLRLLEAARLYRLLDRPTIIVSGGVTQRQKGAESEADAMRTAILRLGVPSDRIVVEAESKTTREEAIIIDRMLKNAGRQPVVLVTSPTHMSRSLAVFRAIGIDAIPSVAAFKSEHALEKYRWLPSDLGLLLSDSVVYDTAAELYYRARGWTPR